MDPQDASNMLLSEPFRREAGRMIPVSLQDQEMVVLSPVLPTDIPRVLEAIELLSEQSLFTRFFTGKRPSDRELEKWLATIDQDHHIAWGALHPSRPELPGIGIVHVIQLPSQPGYAELAITVIDEYQHQGLGSHFLALSYVLCQKAGIHTLVAEMVTANEFAVNLLLALGGRVREQTRDGVALELPVPIDVASLPQTGELQGFLDKIQWINQHW